jgi:hypothetical protein
MGNKQDKSVPYLYLSKDLENRSRALYDKFAISRKQQLEEKDLLALLTKSKELSRDDKIHDFLVPGWRLQEFVFSLLDGIVIFVSLRSSSLML